MCSKYKYFLKPRLFNTYLTFLFTFLLLLSCITPYHSKKTIEDRRVKQEKIIENRTKSDANKNETYESLGFGPLHIYKPDAFTALDSLYALKYKYEQQGNLQEYKNSGIEEQIEFYKQSADTAKTDITYEMEHIYSLKASELLTIHHDYYLLDHKDSIISHTPLYEYTIPVSLKEMQLNYLFELHFITENERFISKDEQTFIQYYKEREQELIRSGELQNFMVHTLELMQTAKRIRSVNTLDLIKELVRIKIKELPEEATAINFGTLLAHENKSKELIKYEIEVSYKTPNGDHQKVFEFSPYLEHIYK